MQSKNLFYILACLSFSLICGAGLYEHVVLWPKAFASLPGSLTAFQGSYGLNNGIFWQMIHPLTLVFFIIALVLSWRSERKKHVLYPLITYAVVLVITFAWFVPVLLELIHTPYSNTHDSTLTSRASRWETLSIVRAFVLFGSAIYLFLGLTKPVTQKTTA